MIAPAWNVSIWFWLLLLRDGAVVTTRGENGLDDDGGGGGIGGNGGGGMVYVSVAVANVAVVDGEDAASLLWL